MSRLDYVIADNPFDGLLPELARVNRFTMADLEQNRNGKISDAQWPRLLFRILQPVRYTGGALVGWLFFGFLVRTFVPSIVLWLAGVKGLGTVFVLGVTLSCSGAFLFAILKSSSAMALLIADLSAGRAACIEGRISPSREDEQGLGVARLYGETNTNCWYVVKDERFEVEAEALAALPDRTHFRLYHTPKSKLLLSIEPVDTRVSP